MREKDSKSFSLIDRISVGVDRMQRITSPCGSRKHVRETNYRRRCPD